MTTDMRPGRCDHPGGPRAEPDPVAEATRDHPRGVGRAAAGRALAALALVGVVVGTILLVTDIRADGVDCGSPASPDPRGASASAHVDACGDELDTRWALAWITLAGTGAVAVFGGLATRAVSGPRRN